MRAEKVGSQTVLAQIVQMVAQAPAQQGADAADGRPASGGGFRLSRWSRSPR
jgi:hypothetical protein